MSKPVKFPPAGLASPSPTQEMSARGIPFLPLLADHALGFYNFRNAFNAFKVNYLGASCQANYTASGKAKFLMLGNSIGYTTGGFNPSDKLSMQLAGRLLTDPQALPVVYVGLRMVRDDGAYDIGWRAGTWVGRGITDGSNPADVGIFASATKSANSTGNGIWYGFPSGAYNYQVGSALMSTALRGFTHVGVVYNQNANGDTAARFQVNINAAGSSPPTPVTAADSNNGYGTFDMKGDGTFKPSQLSPLVTIPQLGWWLPGPERTCYLRNGAGGGVMDVVGFYGACSSDSNGLYIVDGYVSSTKLDYFTNSLRKTAISNIVGSDPCHVNMLVGANELSAGWTASQVQTEATTFVKWAQEQGWSVSFTIVPAPTGQTNNYIDKVVVPLYTVANDYDCGILDLGAVMGTYAYPTASRFAGDGTHLGVGFHSLVANLWADMLTRPLEWA